MSPKQREKSITNNNATIKSIESAIECNLQLQTELARRLSMIAEKKASNRRLASRVTAQVVSTWNELDCLKTPPDVTSVPKNTSSNRKKNSDEPSNDSKKIYVGKKWKFDPYRKWTRRFFVDPEGSIPEPNDDIVKRRKLEEGKFFFHTCPPWSKKEEQTLVSIVTNMMKKCEKSFEDLEFDQVASALEERMKTVDKNSPATAKPRSGVECRLKYADAVKKTPFTKAQSIKILEQVHLHNGAPSWPEVAAGVDRSTWECLTTYMTKLSSSRGQPFTPAEDELLLKIVAAAGPQFVLNTGIAADLAARFFPDRSPKQVLSRLNGSLVNPNFAREVWSDEEERRLVLLMKVYRDTQFPITGAVVSLSCLLAMFTYSTIPLSNGHFARFDITSLTDSLSRPRQQSCLGKVGSVVESRIFRETLYSR